MEASNKNPSRLQIAGEVCESCRPIWEEEGKPVKHMVQIPITTETGVPIVVCPYCDSDVLVRQYHVDS